MTQNRVEEITKKDLERYSDIILIAKLESEEIITTSFKEDIPEFETKKWKFEVKKVIKSKIEIPKHIEVFDANSDENSKLHRLECLQIMSKGRIISFYKPSEKAKKELKEKKEIKLFLKKRGNKFEFYTDNSFESN